MNSYINLILDAGDAKERLQKSFQSALETEKNTGGSADNKHRCGNVVISGADSAWLLASSREPASKREQIRAHRVAYFNWLGHHKGLGPA
jgi:hypothetical protein